MGFHKLGVAFCTGLSKETLTLCKILESHGFDVSSVACTVEGGCNPVGQAVIEMALSLAASFLSGANLIHDVGPY